MNISKEMNKSIAIYQENFSSFFTCLVMILYACCITMNSILFFLPTFFSFHVSLGFSCNSKYHNPLSLYMWWLLGDF